MKVYFIFDVKEQFISLYQNNYRVLYNILRQIYYLDKEEVNYAYTLFRQLTNVIDKNVIDRDIFLKCHKDIPYSKRGNIHYINNLYKDEVSRLTIRKSYIKLEAEQLNSSFFELLKKYSNNFFVCDFKNQNYYFLNNVGANVLGFFNAYGC